MLENKNKLFLVILLLVLLLLAGVSYIANEREVVSTENTSDNSLANFPGETVTVGNDVNLVIEVNENSSWSTFQADRYGLSFEYPTDSFVQQDAEFLRIQNYIMRYHNFAPYKIFRVSFSMQPKSLLYNGPFPCPLDENEESNSDVTCIDLVDTYGYQQGDNYTIVPKEDVRLLPCAGQVVDYEIIDVNGVEMYKGVTPPNPSGVRTAEIVCVDRGDYYLHITGDDQTGQGVFDRIVNSIQFN